MFYVSYLVTKYNLIFREACELRHDETLKPLSQITSKVNVATLRCYRTNRGKGDRAVDASTFFCNKPGVKKAFITYWNSKGNKSETGLDKDMEKLKKPSANMSINSSLSSK